MMSPSGFPLLEWSPPAGVFDRDVSITTLSVPDDCAAVQKSGRPCENGKQLREWRLSRASPRGNRDRWGRRGSIGAGLRLPLSSDRCDHRSDADDIEGSSEIVDERGETELAANIVEAPHQEGALIHPLLDRAEGVLDGL